MALPWIFANRIIHLYRSMMETVARTDLYFKVEVEHDEEEGLERLVSEIERQLRKLYVVRSVEFSNAVSRPEN